MSRWRSGMVKKCFELICRGYIWFGQDFSVRKVRWWVGGWFLLELRIGRDNKIRVEMFALCFVELPLLKTRYQPLRKTLGSIKVYLWWYHPSTSFVKRALKFYQLSVLRGFLCSLFLSLGEVAAIKLSHARKANFFQNPSVSRQYHHNCPCHTGIFLSHDWLNCLRAGHLEWLMTIVMKWR